MKRKLQVFRTSMARGIGLGLLALGIGLTANAQTYLSESFDGTWSGTPSAPAGWSQSRIVAQSANATLTPIANGTSGEKDWQKSTFAAGAWSPAPYSASGPSAGAISGSGALSLEDGNYNGASTPRSERRIESSVFDLSGSAAPYVRFWYYNIQGPGVTLNVRVVISNDGGTTWKTLSNIVNGATVTNNTWQRINIKIPAAYKVANAKIGFSLVNRWGTGDPFIDDLTVEEFTPATITSAANGDWNVAATWSGGVVPTADNNVVIDHNVVVTNTTSTTGIVARCQDLTINSGKILSHGAGTANLLHILGNLDITGTLNAFNSTSGRMVYVNGNVTINAGGTATFNTGTTAFGTVSSIPTAVATGASGLMLLNADAASFTNNGTLTGGRINNVWHLGSGTFTYNSAAGVPFSFALVDGNVNPNGNLTLGNAAASGATQNIIRVKGSFTSAPVFSNTNMTQRNLAFFTLSFTDVTPQNLSSGHEIHDNSGRIITGALLMNTYNSLTLTYPLTVGTATTGALTLTNGIIITSASNLLSTSLFFAPPTGTSPSTATPPTTAGSYIYGPLKVNFPSTGTTTRNFPLGAGSAFNGLVPNSNIRRNIAVATSTAWAGQTITGSVEAAPSGAVSGTLSKVIGNRSYRLNLNGGADLPATATINITGNNYSYGNTDNLVGSINNLFVAQSTTLTGTWASRSASAGSGAFAANTDYSKTTVTAAPGPVAPLATNGEYFAFASDAVLMTYSAGEVIRETATLPVGVSTNAQMLRIKVTTTGVLPVDINEIELSTAGTSTSGMTNLVNAKLWYTGTSSTFATTTQFGTTAVAPSGVFTVSGSQSLTNGDNYFWLTYDIGSGAALNDSFAAECISVVMNGILHSQTAPVAGIRMVSFPMTYVSSTATQSFTTKITTASSNNVIVGMEVVGSALGSTIPLTSIDISTNGTDSLPDITNLKVWSTGGSSTFATTTQFGSTVATPGATQTVTGSTALVNNTNYFWITYDIISGATLGHHVDAEITSATIDGVAQIPTVTAPAGNRQIKGAYCVPTQSGGSLFTNVTIGSMNHSPAAGATPFYRSFSVGTATASITKNVPTSLSVTNNAASIVSVWIDYNDDGTFSSGEWTQVVTASTANAASTVSITIPCTAVTGQVAMRIRSRNSGNVNGSGDACSAFGSGECMDYVITIVDNSLMVKPVEAIQQIGLAAPGATDREVLRVPVKSTGCGVAVATELRFSTTGSTAASSDIVAAKLYATGNSPLFNTSRLMGTVIAPSGAFSFTIADTLTLNDTTNYWLAYDVSVGAALSNLVDATFDSIQAIGVYYVPTVGDPSGAQVITAPMTYVSSAASQAQLSKIELSSANNNVIGFEVVTSATGSPINITSLDVATTGTDSLPDITNLKVWYTGSSSAFATTAQFGSTVINPGATQTVTGNQSLTNGANHFWVTYDIAATATVGHNVDGEITSATVGGMSQIPSVSAPAGVRQIRNAYCPSAATNTADEEIISVTFASVTNASACSAVASGTGSAASFYNNYTGLTPISVTKGTSVPFSLTLAECNTGTFNSSVAIYIDYNSDGDFTDAGENTYSSLSFTGTLASNGGLVKSGSVSIPCTASLGETRMRIVYYETGTLSPCGAPSAWGETEDYTLNIVDNPLAYISSEAVQVGTSVVAPGSSDIQILKVPVRVNGCGVATITEMRFSTSGSTVASDITSAKLYKTDTSSTFSTANLIGTVSFPGGQFMYTLTDTIATNITTNYWLAYDVSGSATLTHIVDATFDSLVVLGSYQVPSVSNPSGVVTVDAPMTYVSSAVTQTATSKVEINSTNNKIIGLEIATSAIGSPEFITSLDIATTGTDSLPDITNLKVWYTGSSNTFAATTQFGSTVAVPAATQSVTGSQGLVNGTNYFWVTYDIASVATVGHNVDGEITAAVFGGATQFPSVTAPAGVRQIRNAYCASAATNTADEEIISVTFASVTNASACSAVASGAGSAASFYNNYTGLTPINVTKGTTVPFSLTLAECNTGTFNSSVAIYIDYNSDGDFTDAGENTYSSLSFTGTLATNGGLVKSGSVSIPCTASLGETRMRIVYYETGTLSPCGAPSAWGETEDYMLNIVDNPLAYVSSEAIQNVNTVAPGTSDIQILKVPVRVNGCGVATITEMRFSTSGSTVASDIVSAKLYKTGTSSTFSTANLIGTVAAPSGQFMFTITDTVVNNDFTNYWLAYDVSGSATLTNIVDATFDSLMVLGSYQVPSVSNPSGVVTVDAPMVYVSSAVTQSNTSKVETGSANNRIVGLEIVTSAIGSPEFMTSLDVAATGTDSLPDITNLKVWYTGSSNTFAATTQFGSTVAVPAATQSVTGSQGLVNGTNYFWVTYDIAAAATIGHNVDGEITAVVIGGATQVPSVTAPAGVRQIRSAYCASAATNTADEEIISVTFGAMTNASACGAVASGAGSASSFYNNYTGLAPVNVSKGGIVPFSLTLAECNTGTFNSSVGIYIDYNSDGDFTDADENVYSSLSFTGTLATNGGAVKAGSVSIPCTASLGETRMRIVYYETATLSPCGAPSAWGETEDYMLNITDNPYVYTSGTSSQSSATVAPGSTDVKVMNISLTGSGCGIGTVSDLYFSTAGTTSTSDITVARLYKTGTSAVFSTANLVATVSSPGAQFNFSGFMDTLSTVVGAINNYWLAFDIIPGAASGNTVDATIDSIAVQGVFYIPSVTAPAGLITLQNPMTFVSSTVTQSNTSKVETGSVNNLIVGYEVVTSVTGSPINLTSLDVSTSGTISLADITNLRVWYTGSSNVFATTTQFGSAVAAPGASETVTGTQALTNGTNYFWVSYDIPSSATLGNVVDAGVTSAIIAGAAQVPTVSMPAGDRLIRAPYCNAPHTAASVCISNVSFNTLNNTSVGSCALPSFTIFPAAGATTTTLIKGGTYTFSTTIDGNSATGSLWIDYDGNGVFDASEWYDITRSSVTGVPNTISITIPMTATTGSTHIRIRSRSSTTNTGVNACTSFGSGETEEYEVAIVPTPPTTVYTWNVTGTGAFGTAANWTPNRNTPVLNDILVVNGGGATAMTGVTVQTVKSLYIASNTGVTMNGAALTASDSLSIGAGSTIITGAGASVVLGSSGASTGVLDGTGTIDGVFTRWVAASTGTYVFPLATGSDSRAASISYTTAPTVAGKLSFRFVTGVPGTTGLPVTDGALTLANMDVTGVWRSTGDGTLSGGTFDVSVNANNVPAVNDFTMTALLARTNSGSSWLAVGTQVSTTGSNAAMVLGRTGLTSYGEMGVAGTSVNPLPVVLTSFGATAQSGDVLTSWTTASEINNKGFEVERSVDGRVFEYAGFVKGAGTSTGKLSYSFTDAKAFDKAAGNVLYYRLKQVDFNGRSVYSQIVKVVRTAEKANSLLARPNPFGNVYSVSFNAMDEGTVMIRMMDIQGRVVSEHFAKTTVGMNEIVIEDLDQLRAGVYFVNVTVDGETQVLKLIKN
jgi:hypothetical protein